MFADAIGYINEFDPVAVKAACEAAGIDLDNGESAAKAGIHLDTKGWYDPYSFLSGEFSFAQRHLFAPFSNGDYVYLMNLMLRAPTDANVKLLRAKEAERQAADDKKIHMLAVKAQALKTVDAQEAAAREAQAAADKAAAREAEKAVKAVEKAKAAADKAAKVSERKKKYFGRRRKKNTGASAAGVGEPEEEEGVGSDEDGEDAGTAFRRASSLNDALAAEAAAAAEAHAAAELADAAAAAAHLAVAAVGALDEGRGCGFDLEELATSSENALLAFFVMHHPGERAELVAKWMKWDWPWKIPVDDINEYFGKVTFPSTK
jgi:hypothetical protein